MNGFDDRQLLRQVRIAAPCSASWERMEGDERKRFCADCKHNVYNLSGMSEQAAADLVRNAEGRLCVRFYQRADGTMMAHNCPVGFAAARRRLLGAAASTVAAFLFVLATAFAVLRGRADASTSYSQKKAAVLQTKPFNDASEAPPVMTTGIMAPIECAPPELLTK